MNLTLSIDEALAERARAVAAGRGKGLNQLVRDLLEAETFLCFGPDTLAEARNRGYKPYKGDGSGTTSGDDDADADDE